MAKFVAYRLRGVSAYHDNGLIVNISEERLEIRKVSPYAMQQVLKSLSKQYEITQEQFQSEFKELLAGFPEVKEVVNG